VPVIVSHLKCSGVDNWGRSEQVLGALDQARPHQPVGQDCYPYAASSSTLDLKQVTDRSTSSSPGRRRSPAMGGKMLAAIAASGGRHCWRARAACSRPARHHGMSPDDVDASPPPRHRRGLGRPAE